MSHLMKSQPMTGTNKMGPANRAPATTADGTPTSPIMTHRDGPLRLYRFTSMSRREKNMIRHPVTKPDEVLQIEETSLILYEEFKY